ncbi:MAG TPA: glycogen debranching protein GlgX [Acidimicrobiales bacterium]|nr:glycogen debranching protein GlgX [Acidimicrobiales bacterium]
MTPQPGSPRPGRPFPLGATPGDGGTNFAVVAGDADGVDLCLFDAAGAETRVALVDVHGDVWHGFVPGVGPGQAYGYRVHGAFDPAGGRRANPAKLLLDPYARATVGAVRFGPAVLGHREDDPGRPSDLDSAGSVPRSLVVESTGSTGPAAPADRPRPWHRFADTVLYEVHVKGFTMTHPGVPAALRGTYAGLAHPAALAHLVDLGVTTVELLPVHQHVPEGFLDALGLTNYWGYNTIGYFAPHDEWSAAVRAGQPGGQVAEFRAMVDALHGAGLEVVLDVVFNHTAEGDHAGPTLCFRGLDNRAYYRLDPDDPARYVDTTGCGNTVDTTHPVALRLIMDSLRYWITEMGVDGFRFDLAASLARDDRGFDRVSAFLDVVAQDPVVSRAKLIAEPWDVGQADSYELGRFPPLWREWNGRYRDTVRDFWRSHDGLLGDFACRLTGSADLFDRDRRRPTASVNLVTVHDGFTLADLVAYDGKHNDANGDDNRDGTDDNRSWNCGVEGPTDDPAVRALRGRQQRALLATLLLSDGVPLLLGGDELGRTQRGNNNAYCQDNDLSWFDWAAVDADLLAFTRRLVALRRGHPVFRRDRFLDGPDAAAVQWFTPAGTEMTAADWADPGARAVAVHLDGAARPDRDADGRPMVDDDFLLVVNGWWEPLDFALPPAGPGRSWVGELDTFDPATVPAPRPGGTLPVGPRSLVVLRSA